MWSLIQYVDLYLWSCVAVEGKCDSVTSVTRFFRGSPCQLLEFQTKVYARLDRNATLGERAGGAIDATVYKECVVACVGEVSSP